jgi:TolB-like protein
MAPEQCKGESVDRRADLFAAGAILFEMLTGKCAFNGRTPVEVFHAVMYEQPPALRGSPAVNLVDRALRRALSKRPEERQQSAGALAAELRSALESESSGDVRAHAVTRLMVLPLRILRPDPDTDFLAFSIADAIASGLSALDSLVVRSSAAAARYAEGILDLARIAGEAEIDVVLTGTLVRAGSQIRVNAQLLEARTGTLLWSDTPQVSVRDVFELQDQIVSRIVESLSLSLTARERRVLKHDVPASPSAYEYYLRGNQIAVQGLRGGETLQVARQLYQRSVDEDPAYAPAWARLGRCHWLIAKGIAERGDEELARAESCFQRALELNPDLPLAHNLYAHFQADRGQAAEGMARLLKRAHVGGGEPELFAALVQVCRFCGLPEASLAAHERVRRLDPQLPTSANHTLWQLGEYSRSLREMNKGTFYLDALILATLGRKEEAMRLLRDRQASNLAPVTHSYVVSLRALLEGNREESLRATDEALRNFRDPEGRFYLARHFAYFGDAERTLSAMREVVEHGFLPHRLADDEWLRSLRGLPQFEDLLREVASRRRENASIFSKLGGSPLLGTGAS